MSSQETQESSVDRTFCVYFHINPVKRQVFYVGKGKSNRPNTTQDRNILWKRTVAKYGKIVTVPHTNLTEAKAFALEVFYIKYIGRRDLGTGPLVNMTSGGDGPVPGPQARANMSRAQMGHGCSPEARAKMSAARLRRGPASDVTKARISAAVKARFADPAQREAMSIRLSGQKRKPLSAEHKALLSKIKTGKKIQKWSAEHRAKVMAGVEARREARSIARNQPASGI